VSLPSDRSTVVLTFYAGVARSRSGSSSFTALALNKPSSSCSSLNHLRSRPAGFCGAHPQTPSNGRPLRPCTAGTIDLLLARCSLAEYDPTLLAGTVAWRDSGESPFGL